VQIPDEAQTHFFILVSKYLGVSALIMIPHTGYRIEEKERGGSKDTKDASAILRLKRMKGKHLGMKKPTFRLASFFRKPACSQRTFTLRIPVSPSGVTSARQLFIVLFDSNIHLCYHSLVLCCFSSLFLWVINQISLTKADLRRGLN